MYTVACIRVSNVDLEAHSFPRASLSENCSLLGTDNVRGQISEHIFAPNEGYCLYTSSFLKYVIYICLEIEKKMLPRNCKKIIIPSILANLHKEIVNINPCEFSSESNKNLVLSNALIKVELPP